VATDWHRYFGEGRNPLDALRIWDGGLGIWGAIALGAVGALIGCRVKGVPLPAFGDAIAPGIVVAQAIGRVGNYFNQELYGGPTDLPWGLELYRRVNEQGAEDNLNGVAINHIPIDGSPVHPTFLYELIWNILVAVLVVWLDRKLRLGHGRAFAVYVMGYTLGRTWIELMRTDDATQVFGVRINVWVSILVFLGAAVYFVLARRKGEREDPASLRGKDAPPPDEPGDEADPDDLDEDDDFDDDLDGDLDDDETDDESDDLEKTGKKPGAEKTGTEKVGATKVVTEKASGEKVTTEPGAKTVADKAGTKPVAEKTAAEPVAEKTAAKPVADKAGAEPGTAAVDAGAEKSAAPTATVDETDTSAKTEK
jgi:prolipoprotein diacylglyceryl transferase